MMKRTVRLCLFVLLGVLGLAVTRSGGYPAPALVPMSWQLAFTYQTPQTIAVRMVDGGVRWYWFMPYKVVNHTDKVQLFVPDFTVTTEKGNIVAANKNIAPHVFTAIKKRLANRLLENPLQVSGRLLQGEDYAKESVVIWPRFDHDVDQMRIFSAGLSGELKAIRHPVTGDELTLRKTRMLIYQTPGTPTAAVSPRHQPVKFLRDLWVMR